MSFCIGCDLGTSALKMTLADEKGNIIDRLSLSYPVSIPKDGYSQQDPQDYKKALYQGIEFLAEKGNQDILGIAIDGQMHGLITLDEKGDVLYPCILWNDSRSKEECDYLNRIFTKERLLKETGNIAYPGFTLPKLLWMKKNLPGTFQKIKHILLPKDYCNFILTGKFTTDPSDMAGSLFYSVKERKYSESLLELSSIRKEMLPEILQSGQFIGYTNEETNKACHLKKPIKVFMGCGDNAAAALCVGLTKIGQCNISLGTSGTIFANTSKTLIDSTGAIHSFINSNGDPCLLSCMLSCASCLKWFNEEILQTKDYQSIQEKITLEDIKSNDVFFLPYLMGERSPINDPDAKGAFFNLSLKTDRKQLTLSILEGVSFALKDSFEKMKEMSVSLNEAYVTGGGSKSPLWKKILSSILDIPLIEREENDGPSYGMCLLILKSTDRLSSYEDAFQDKKEEIIYPDCDLVSFYKKKYQKFRQLYPALKPLYQSFKLF